MAKFVSVVCDRCKTPFIQDRYWTKDFQMDTGKDICPNCLKYVQG